MNNTYSVTVYSDEDFLNSDIQEGTGIHTWIELEERDSEGDVFSSIR